jgi:hypothetical protein
MPKKQLETAKISCSQHFGLAIVRFHKLQLEAESDNTLLCGKRLVCFGVEEMSSVMEPRTNILLVPVIRHLIIHSL